MKKILCIIVLIMGSFTSVFALTSGEQKVVNLFVKQIERLAERRGNFLREPVVEILQEKKQDISYEKGKIVEEIIDILEKNIENERKALAEAEKKRQEDIAKALEKKEQEAKRIAGIQDIYGVNIDIGAVRDYWLQKINHVRKEVGLSAYTHDIRLQGTAQEWSEYQKSIGVWTHKRNPTDSFYNYDIINKWFSQRGVVCKNIHRVTHSENIGYGKFSCSDGECSEELQKGLDSTFNFYMNEKGTTSDAHYQSIVNRYFRNIGIGVSVQEIAKNKYKYYLTVHYCTEVK